MSDQTNTLIEQVNSAISSKQAVVIQGSGTKNFLGRPIEDSANVISTAEHTGIISYEPVELVMTARAGTTLAEIDDALDKNKQMLACDPARFGGKATIGGSLAANQAGPSRPWTGSLRDHVLGTKLINGKGEHLKFGGKVMKNVAGYDVSRLQAGAMGTLGLITELSFKVLPIPPLCITLTRPVSTQDDVIQQMNKAAGEPKPMTAACWFDGQLYLQLSGAKTAVESYAGRCVGEILGAEQTEELWQGLREQQLDFFTNRKAEEPLWRFSVNSTAPAFLEDADWFLDWGGAQRWLKGDFEYSKLQEWANKNGGEVTLYRGGDRNKEVYPQPNSVMKDIQKNLKKSFDPDNIFNIGRLYSWL